MTRVGIDMIEIGRIRETLERYSGFKDRCFTPAEQAYCDGRANPAQHYAARFAGKEAVGKALGLGVARLFAWRDIEIAGRPKPSVRLSGRVEAWSRRVEAGAIDLSMSHSRELASAVCVVADRMADAVRAALHRRRDEGGGRGHDVDELMARAGRAVADEILSRFPTARTFSAVCGRGANGGDGRIAAELLRSNGWEERAVGDADVVVDALFGTGFHGAPREEAAQQIRAMNECGAPIVAVDIPSGVDASTGEVPGDAVQASLTVTFHGRKVGHEVAPGRFHRGELVVADIGLEPRETEHALVTAAILDQVPRRKPGDTKYTAGSVLVVGGSPGMTGAACLTAEAVLRADAGYVVVAAPTESLPVIESRLLEAVKRPLDDVWDAAGRRSAGDRAGPGS